MPFQKGKLPEGAKPFTSENQPENKGRPKGSRNRATILKEILSTLSNFKNPLTKTNEEMEVEKAIELAILGKALKGDVSAYKEIKDTVYGKNPDKLEISITPEIEAARALFESLVNEKGYPKTKAVRETLKAAKLSGFELSEDDILDANTIG